MTFESVSFFSMPGNPLTVTQMAESLQTAEMTSIMADEPLNPATTSDGFQWLIDVAIITGVLAVAYFAATQIIEWREENKRIKSRLTD